jgi:CMP-N,N'-diacetyllegionaminic acid synthase
MYDTGILDLDHENDFELMEVVANYLFEKNSEFAMIKNVF